MIIRLFASGTKQSKYSSFNQRDYFGHTSLVKTVKYSVVFLYENGSLNKANIDSRFYGNDKLNLNKDLLLIKYIGQKPKEDNM